MADRRAFLRGLASLPLIGGSVALIGNPSAAAVPVSRYLLDSYMDFLAIELRETVIQSRETHAAREGHPDCPWVREATERHMWAPERPHMRGLLDASGRPSARAAVILSAAGVPWMGGHLD
ncbi:hypothetical protein [Lichenibacterium dinghuense]|uniref:hypothetical protein n=1 Tax=Lichenibacterium dinghuense TaxID=2895977 RepID=UPI001F2694C2|nr:hypothetical protein [Lichenibacterium sp. 6Y81]